MKKKSLGVNAVLNGIKQACSVIFPFLSFAYCSRIIGKEGLGVYSFSQSIVSYFILVAALGIPNYAAREGAAIRDNREELNRFTSQVYSISILSMLLGYLLLFGSVALVPKLQSYELYIYILSAQLILNTIGADWINTIYEDYYYLTIRYIILQIASFVCLIIFVRSPSDLIAYTLITMLSNVGGNIVNVIYLKKQKLYPGITWKIEFRKHIIPIVILFASSVAGIIYLNSDITMLGFYLSEGDVGVYTVSSKVYMLVKTLINAVIMVTVPRFSYYLSNNMHEEYKYKINIIADILVIIIIPCIIGITMLADRILNLFAGVGYEAGAGVVTVLGFSLLFAVGACFISYSILIPNKKEKEFMIATIAAAIVNMLLNLYFIPNMGIIGAAYTTLIAEFVVFGITMYYAQNIILPQINMRSLFSSFMGGIGVFVVCIITKNLHMDVIVSTTITIALSAIVYVLILIITRCPVIHMARNRMARNK